jgi:zinc transporter 9
MFLFTTLIGYLTTLIRASPKTMNLISLFGAGLLVGAAILIIIPEGIVSLYTALEDDIEIDNAY